jgi:hypothetical protein
MELTYIFELNNKQVKHHLKINGYVNSQNSVQKIGFILNPVYENG